MESSSISKRLTFTSSSFSKIFLSICSRVATLSNDTAVCSIWALLKKPKIPILVINIRTIVAVVKYVLIKNGVLFQFIWSHTAVVIFAISKTVPIIITEITAEANIVANPAIL